MLIVTVILNYTLQEVLMKHSGLEVKKGYPLITFKDVEL